MTDSTPTPPDSLPNYLAEGVPKQSTETLEDLADYVAALLEYQREPVVEALSEDVEVVEEEAEKGGTLVKERVKCGSDCTCNEGTGHGPYLYRYFREGGRLKSEYVGKP